jgi:hypothetical protein
MTSFFVDYSLNPTCQAFVYVSGICTCALHVKEEWGEWRATTLQRSQSKLLELGRIMPMDACIAHNRFGGSWKLKPSLVDVLSSRCYVVSLRNASDPRLGEVPYARKHGRFTRKSKASSSRIKIYNPMYLTTP